MPLKLSLVPLTEEYSEAALKAHFQTVSRDTRMEFYRVIVEVEGSQFLVKKSRQFKSVVQLTEGLFDLSFVPVAMAMPDYTTPTHDYRNGVGRTKVTQADVDAGTYPLLALNDRLPGTSVVHGTFKTAEVSYSITNETSAGTSSWYGDSPNVISWNGIGAMDAVANDYRSYYFSNGNKRYTMPGYESHYYSALDRQAMPESGNHLNGDRAYTKTDAPTQKPFSSWDCNVIFKNGKLLTRMPHPVIAACQIADPDPQKAGKYLLRVLCGSWTTPEQYTPIQGNSDVFFEAHVLGGFVLYDQVSGVSPIQFTSTFIPMPDTSDGSPSWAFLAQQPSFNSTGTKCVGLLENGFGGPPDTQVTALYHDNKLINQVKAWVFEINATDKVCTLVEMARQHRYQRDTSSPSDSRYERTDNTQILAVGYSGSGPYIKIVRNESVTITKYRKDSQSQIVEGIYYPSFGPSGTAEDGGQYIWDVCAAAAGGAGSDIINYWKAGNPGQTLEGPKWVHFAYKSDNNNNEYDYKPYVGASGFTNATGIELEVFSGALRFSGSYNLASVGDQLFKYTHIGGALAQVQETTTLTERSFTIYGNPVAQTSKQDFVATAGYKLMSSASPWLQYIGPASAAIPGDLGNLVAWLSVNISYGPVLYGASSSTGAEPDAYKVVAADPRKSAAITKNINTGAYQFHGIPVITL